MKVSRETLDRLIALCEGPRRKGEWREFCEREGVRYDTLRYWRQKLSLRKLKYRPRKIVNPALNPTTA